MADITVEFFLNGDTFVVAECWVSGRMIPTTFEHDKEDERDIDAHTVSCFAEDGEKVNPSDEFLNGIYNRINANFNKIYNAASYGEDSILI